MSKLKSWWRRVRPRILAPLAYYVAKSIGMSLRLKVENWERYQDEKRSLIISGWHGQSFIAATFFRGQGVWTLISLSRDGELQHGVFTRFGFKSIRGSTGRGGVKALIESIKVLKSGARLAFTPDGPRGPAGIVQEGIITMAQKSGAYIVPVGLAAKRCWHVPTWDRYMVPKPFSKAIITFSDPIEVPSNADKEELERIRIDVQAAMHRIQAEADRQMEQ